MGSTTLDAGRTPAGSNEELAGPPHAVAPVDREERISSIDLLRGFSLMGILVMNICDFAYGFSNYTFPINTVKPVFNGPHWKANTAVWFLRWILAEGKMRALFSMLFGAGVILLTERGEKRGAGLKVADIYTRRNMWLVLFGMLHGFLIWQGDILFYYGTSALLFLFPFRNLRAKRLIWIAGIVLALNSAVVGGGQFGSTLSAKKAAEKVNVKLAKNQPLEEKDQDALKKWKNVQERWRVPTKKMYEDIAANQKGYWAAQGHAAGDVLKGEMKGAYFGFGDWFGMMLLGMALYRNGFLTAKLPQKTYAWCAVIGLAISWTVVGIGTRVAWKGGFDLFQSRAWTDLPYDIGRVSGAIGNAAFLMVLLKSGVFKWGLQRIAAVGQMALSNYLLTSITMQFLFVWGPLHWYGYMEYYKIYYVVLGMWTVNLVFSSIWLRYFRFGPAEWVWRSLTYWKRQPMRLPKEAAVLA